LQRSHGSLPNKKVVVTLHTYVTNLGFLVP
jgi:hypothetical protein